MLSLLEPRLQIWNSTGLHSFNAKMPRFMAVEHHKRGFVKCRMIIGVVPKIS